jgi:Secretion system C-terminal sorting domain
MKNTKTLILLPFYLLLFITANSQGGWHEVRSDVINAYSTSEINALTKNSNGTILYAAIGGNVLKWEANTWTQLGALNANSAINTLATDAAGNVYASGFFSNSNNFGYVAKWNGSTWTELGTGANALNANGPIYSMAIDGAGNVYVGGSFSNSVGKKYVAKWNGTTWSELGGLGALNANGFIWAVASDASGNIYAGGGFTNANNKNYVAKWNGSAWSELGGPNALNANGSVITIATDGAGNIYAAGHFTNANVKRYVAKWNGSSWSELGTGANALNANDWIHTVIADGIGNVYAAGSFVNATSKYVAKWNGSNWTEVGNGANALNANAAINSIVKLNSGDIYAAGDFTNSSVRYVAKWNSVSNAWSETGSGGVGELNANGWIYVIHKDVNNYLYAAGTFNAGPLTRRIVSRWNGIVWSEVGASTGGLQPNDVIVTLTSDAAGNIYTAGYFSIEGGAGHGKRYVAKWSPATNNWTELGGYNSLSANGAILTLTVDPQGNLYAAGAFTNANGKYYVAKWTAATNSWSELGGLNALNANNGIASITADATGNVYATGSFTIGSNFNAYVAKYNGTTWAPVGTGGELTSSALRKVLVVNPNLIYVVGDLVTVGGQEAIGKWNGTSWTRFAGNNGISFSAPIWELAKDNAGNLYAGGDFYNSVGRTVVKWNGTIWTEVGTGTEALNADGGVHSIILDNADSIFAAGEFRNSQGEYIVSGSSLIGLPQPGINGVSNKCQNSPTAKGKLTNPPVGVTITITQDNQPLTYTASDSSFIYFTSGVTATGNHLITVKYISGSVTKQRDTSYTVFPVVVPTILLSGNTTVTSGQSTNLTAVTTNGGGDAQFLWQDSTNSAGWRDIAAIDSLISYTPSATGHKVRVKMTSSLPCPNPLTVTSSALIFTVNITTAIAPVPPNRYGIKVYPNPVSTELVIDSIKISDKWETLEMISYDGKKIMVKKITNQVKVIQPLSTLSSGSYIIVLKKRNGEKAYFKILKN